ncbi:hypothetical protein AK812_SmicGene27044 [Symbiodinium microadriaticum]|uniref:Fumarylacetoacetase-like C-terminal domain-containing protein n=1 Tax=Symbiodinium microadriaticum TaxID=2951 RepID=A0A1Q9D7T2_SYMMI|nr:hypothetical protein AK812_SmicGene27044 [Symbiodinium microadriaticum]
MFFAGRHLRRQSSVAARYIACLASARPGTLSTARRANVLKGFPDPASPSEGPDEAEIAKVLAPIPVYPAPAVIVMGLNYRSHAKETGKELPKFPVFAFKNPASVIGPETPVSIPKVAREKPEMSITVEVGLLSGKRVRVDADMNEAVGTMTRRAQIALGVGRGRLVGPYASVLDACAPIKRTRLQNGDSLTLHITRVQVQASGFAFAAILGDGSVVTWGDAATGGDSSAVQDQLKNVQQIQASRGAFAAILADGSVVTWGSAARGGDSSAVQDQLKNVQQIQANDSAFAAILADGSVVTWGSDAYGGDSSAVQDRLNNVQQIHASESSFAAVLSDGSVVTWGDAMNGGDSRPVQDQLTNVKQINAASNPIGCAFAAILGDGSVVTWGISAYGGDSSDVQDQLKNVHHIRASHAAFAAILGNGSVVTWGDAARGGDSSAVQDQLKNVQQIQASATAFAAVLGDGSIVTWGNSAHGGDSSAVQDLLKPL